MTRRADPGRAMHVEPDVALVGHLRLAVVEPDPDTDDRPVRPGVIT